jgi:hypothetical protein
MPPRKLRLPAGPAGIESLAEVLAGCAAAQRVGRPAEAEYDARRARFAADGEVRSQLETLWEKAWPGLCALTKAIPEVSGQLGRLQDYLWYYLDPGKRPAAWPAVRLPADRFLDP